MRKHGLGSPFHVKNLIFLVKINLYNLQIL